MALQRYTQEQYSALSDYVRFIADELALRDWYIWIKDATPDDENTAAQIEVTYGRRSATIVFDRNWFKMAPEELRHNIVHEIMHTHFNGVTMIFDSLKPALGEVAFNSVKEIFRWQSELTVDAITDAIAKRFPLPKIPSGEERISAQLPKKRRKASAKPLPQESA